jgi:hypothetical protein
MGKKEAQPLESSQMRLDFESTQMHGSRPTALIAANRDFAGAAGLAYDLWKRREAEFMQ